MNTKSILSLTAVVAAFALLVAPLAAANVDAYVKQSIEMNQKITNVIEHPKFQ